MKKHPPGTEDRVFLTPVPRAQNPAPQKIGLPLLNTLLEAPVWRWPGRHGVWSHPDGWQGSKQQRQRQARDFHRETQKVGTASQQWGKNRTTSLPTPERTHVPSATLAR